MDKNLMFHSIALEAAKAYANSNASAYMVENGTQLMAKDMTEKYITAYKESEQFYNSTKAKWVY